MKTSFASWKSVLPGFRIPKNLPGLILMITLCSLSFSELKSQTCNLCSIPSFPSVTVYSTFQTGHGIGFGVEAGTWKKDAGKFSYFFGTSMVWAQNKTNDAKTNSSQSQTYLSFYVKGQYKLTSHL